MSFVINAPTCMNCGHVRGECRCENREESFEERSMSPYSDQNTPVRNSGSGAYQPMPRFKLTDYDDYGNVVRNEEKRVENQRQSNGYTPMPKFRLTDYDDAGRPVR